MWNSLPGMDRTEPLVRPARADEAEILGDLAFRSKAYWGYDDVFMAACRAELRLAVDEITARRAMVAERDGHVVGFATLEGDPPDGTLGMLFVDPQSIGRGIGRLLFDHMRTLARGLGFARLVIDADPNAEPFYRAMGAERIGSTPSGSIPGRRLPLLAVAVNVSPGES
jgi:GNAT superfamily N-acetyltransferase